MCKQKLRNMKKPRTLKSIAAWEILFWPIMSGWVVFWYLKKDTDDQDFASLEHQEDVQIQNRHWEIGLWVHGITTFLYAPLAGFLFLGVEKRSRFYIVIWMVFYIIISITRVYAMFIFYRAYVWLKWFEIYWIFRIYFLLCAFNYCLDLWAEDSTCEHIDVPLLIPISDPRPWRGAHNYPEFPISLEQREFIYGTGRHEPMHLDWRFIVHPFPTWFESSDDHSRPVLVIDNPAYNPDTR